jgi:drug/metabolite transporter (DMT)-like permease
LQQYVAYNPKVVELNGNNSEVYLQMRRPLVLSLATMFVGFMGIAMMARTGHLSAMPGYDAMQLIASGACLGASITVFIKSLKSSSAPAPAPAKTAGQVS